MLKCLPFNWLRDTFDLSRNYYDRVGHFAQGFVPAIITREILLRKKPVVKAGAGCFLLLYLFEYQRSLRIH